MTLSELITRHGASLETRGLHVVLHCDGGRDLLGEVVEVTQAELAVVRHFNGSLWSIGPQPASCLEVLDRSWPENPESTIHRDAREGRADESFNFSERALREIARDAARRGGLTRGRVSFEIRLRGDRVTLVASALTAEGTPGSVSVAL